MSIKTITTTRTYESPSMSVTVVTAGKCIAASNTLQDLDEQAIYDEDF